MRGKSAISEKDSLVGAVGLERAGRGGAPAQGTGMVRGL